MGAFKQLKSQDIIVSPLELNKGYEARTQPLTQSNQGYGFILYGGGVYGQDSKIDGVWANDIGIDRYIGVNTKYTATGEDTGYFTSYNRSNIYHSIKQLYYSNYLSGSKDQFGRVVSSDADLPYFRPDGVVTGNRYNPIYDNYRQTDLIEDKSFPSMSNAYIGVLSIVVGNIIYTHGQAILTNYRLQGYHYQDYFDAPYGQVPGGDDYFYSFFSGSEATCSFSSSYTIYETQYKCTIGESEYNYTQNPTAISGSNGDPYYYITESYFSPYVTTVGLYNDSYELLAVGKLAKPLPTSNLTDTTILVNIDRQ